MPKSPVTDGNRLFIVGLDGVIYSLNALSGRVSWKLKLPASPSTGLALRDKTFMSARMINASIALTRNRRSKSELATKPNLSGGWHSPTTHYSCSCRTPPKGSVTLPP